MEYSKKDFLSILPRPASTRGHKTHEVDNMPPEMPDQNLYLGDEVLKSIVKQADIEWIHEQAVKTGGRYRKSENAGYCPYCQ